MSLRSSHAGYFDLFCISDPGFIIKYPPGPSAALDPVDEPLGLHFQCFRSEFYPHGFFKNLFKESNGYGSSGSGMIGNFRFLRLQIPVHQYLCNIDQEEVFPELYIGSFVFVP